MEGVQGEGRVVRGGGGGWRVEGGQCILGGRSREGGWKGGDEGRTAHSGWRIKGWRVEVKVEGWRVYSGWRIWRVESGGGGGGGGGWKVCVGWWTVEAGEDE